MGQYTYLVNDKERFYVEAFKESSSINDIPVIEEPEVLARFLEYCKENKLEIRLVNEHNLPIYWDDINELEPYKNFALHDIN